MLLSFCSRCSTSCGAPDALPLLRYFRKVFTLPLLYRKPSSKRENGKRHPSPKTSISIAVLALSELATGVVVECRRRHYTSAPKGLRNRGLLVPRILAGTLALSGRGALQRSHTANFREFIFQRLSGN